MLRSVEISAELTGPLHGEGFHNLHWDKRLELSLDCFICGRGRRTTSIQYGLEHALCSGDDERLHLGYYCPQARQSGAFSIQTNVVRPRRDTCGHCDHLLATSKDAPTIRLLT
ncbi:hypothetical protein [Streptomyces nigra]|uniref:hypothetical protein n=1 Tax=Streptomyces nigra TaxID=1827580 RepID=UPI003641E14F